MALIKDQTGALLIGLSVLDAPYPYKAQGMVWSAGYWWLCNTESGLSGSGGRESNHINKFDKKGKYLGRMTLLGSGHGSAFAMDGTDVIIGWDSSNGNRYVRKVPWENKAKVKEADAPLLGTNTTAHYPLPLDSGYLTLAKRDNTYMFFYLRLLSAPATTLRTIRVPVYKSPNNSRGPAMQGAFSFGRNVFVQWGWPEDRPQRLDQYQWGDPGSTINYKAPLSSLDITKLGYKSSDTSTEPEGIAVYNGHLVVGKQYNGHARRAFRVFLFSGVGREGMTNPPPPPVIIPWPPVPPPLKPPVDKCANPPINTRLSGASGAGVAAGTFGAWRGSRLTSIGTWMNDPAIYPFTPPSSGCPECGEYAKWGGAADIGLAPADAIWQGWDAEAAGTNDSWWREMGRNLRLRWRDQLRDVWYLRPYYEANGDWFTYAILTKTAAFKTAFARTSAILREEFPEASVMFGVAAASPGTGRPLVSDIWPDDASFESLSIDFYNTFPWVNTQAAFDSKITSGAGANSLEPLRQLALSHDKPVVISEWGSASVNNGGGGGDAPQFITSFQAWVKAHEGREPGEVFMENYFNVAQDYPEQYWLWNTSVNPKQPQAAARYSSLWRPPVGRDLDIEAPELILVG